MEKMKFGVQIYTIRDYLTTTPLFERSIRKIADMGYKYFQLSGEGEGVTTPKRLRELMDETGLVCGLTHWDDKEIVGNTEKCIEDHDIMGVNGIGIGGMPGEFRNYEGYSRFIEKYGPAVEKIHKAGKSFCYHNHWFEFERFENGKTGLEMLLEGMPEGFKFTFDTAWAQIAGIDCAAFIRKYSDKIFATHFKDLTVVDNNLQVTELLTGNMNFDAIVEACVQAGIEWNFVEQDTVRRYNLYDSIKVSLDNIMGRYGDYFLQ